MNGDTVRHDRLKSIKLSLLSPFNPFKNLIPMIKKQYLIIKPYLLMMSHLHETNFKGFSTQKKTDAIPLSILTDLRGKQSGILLILMTYLLGLFSNSQLSARVSGRVFRGLGNNRTAFSLSGFKFLKLTLVASVLMFSLALRAADETLPAGSFIVNLGVVPQTVGNAMKPYGMVYELVRSYKVPIKWVISPTKGKDGIDFSQNGVDYKGGSFVVPAEYRTSIINSRIAYWQSLGVVGATTNASVTAPVYQTFFHMPRWTLDTDNGSIARDYLINAGIPTVDFAIRTPAQLSGCDDIFVLPHADPIWSTHGILHSWNDTHKGAIWSGCHAVSVLENMFDPSNTTQQTNFLMTNGAAPGTAAVDYKDHSDGSIPYNYAYPNDPVMQFMGLPDNAFTNGSEQIYLPQSAWRGTTKIGAWDATQSDVPSLSPGVAALLAYGPGMGNNTHGKVIYAAGHSYGTKAADIALQRVFMNFSFWAMEDKKFDVSLSGVPTTMEGTLSYNFSASVVSNLPPSTYTYQWTSSAGGTFSDPTAVNPTFTAPNVSINTPCIIDCKVVDICGRISFYSQVIPVMPSNTALPPDTDGDGVEDHTDIDDDNDGILDRDEQLCSLSGTWTQISAGVWESPLSSGYKTRVTLGNYNQFWDGASLPSNVTNFNRSCTGFTSNFGTINNTSKPAFQVSAGNGSGSATNASFTVEFLTSANVPVFVQDPKFHLAGIGGNDASNIVTSTKWTLQSGSFQMLSSDGKITATPNTFVHSNLTQNNGTNLSNCPNGEGSGTFKILGNISAYVFDVQMLGSDGLPANIGGFIAGDQFQVLFEDCLVLNTDNEGLANHLDADSDNDGCSDAREGGATLNKTANFAFAGPYGANGLDNSKETPAESGIINYSLTYGDVTNAAINTCTIVPTVGLDSVSGIINQALVIKVLENDKFGGNGPNASAITISQAAAHGTATVNTNGTPTNPTDDFINYTPTANFTGQDSVIYSICDLDGDCSTAVVRITVESSCDNILPNGGFEQVANTFTFPTNFEGVPSRGIAGSAPDNRFASNWVAATSVGTSKVWLLNDTANVVNNPQGYKFAYVKGQFDCAQFCNTTQPNCDWSALLGETLINGMTYEISFYAASWNETISSSGAGVPTGAGAQGATNVVVDLDLQSGPQVTSPLMTVPASSSFNNLNWNKYTYRFTYNALNPVVSIYISQGVGNGFFLDDLKVRKVFEASADQLLCNATSTTVAITPNVNIGIWKVASGSPAGAFIVDESNGTTVVSSLVPGTYNFVKEINGCTDTVQVVNIAPALAGTGSATTVNITSTTTIGLDGLLTGEDAGGTWTQLTGTGGTFDNLLGTFIPTNATNSTFRYTKTGTAPCPTATADVTVNINNTPDAVNDVVATPLIENGANGTVNIVSNDTDPNGNPAIPTNGVGLFVVDMNPTWPGIEATFTNAAGVWNYDKTTGIVTFDPANNFFGLATMQYELCDPLGLCDQASITFTVNGDNDGDGVDDIADLDDDNDGISDIDEGLCKAAKSNPLLDNFDNPQYPNINNNNILTPVLNGWTNPNGANFNVIRVDGTGYAYGPNNAHSGNQYVDISGASDFPERPFTTSVPGVVSASAWFSNRETQTNFAAYVPWTATVDLLSGTNTTPIKQGNSFNFTLLTPKELWVQSSFNNFAIPAGSYKLRLYVDNYGHFDSPEFCVSTDYDGDGIPDYQDLDSDNDGITDIVESGNNNMLLADVNNNGTIDGTELTASPVGADGIPLAAQGVEGTAPPLPLSTDTDGLANYLDLDSDNDGCSDSNEYYNNGTLAAAGQQFGQTGNATAPVSASGLVNLPAATYTGVYANAVNNAIKPACNVAPVATNDVVSTPEDGPLSNSVATNATDADGNLNTTSFATTDSPLHGSIVLNNDGTYTYTPTLNFNGVDSVHYKVCDSGTPSLCDTATIIITINSVNDKPVAGDDYTQTDQGMPVSGVVTTNDSDVDNNLDINSFVKIDEPTKGTIVFNANGSYTYTPNTTFFGIDSIHYKVCDLGAPSLCDTATIFFNVIFVNHNPVAINDVETILEDGVLVNSVATNVTDQDSNLNPTSFVTIDAPLNGSIVLNNDGTYTYTPTLNFNGVDSVHYKVCDYLGLCDTATIIVTVSSVNDAPVAVNDTPNVNEDGTLNSTVATNDTDVDGNIHPMGFTKLDNPLYGTITFNTDGSYIYKPNPNFNGLDSVHYQVCDLGAPALCSTATLIITVNSVNDLPIANVDIRTILEDAPATPIIVLTNDNFGGDGAGLVPVMITAAPKHGVASVNNNGTPSNPTDDTVIYTPTANYNGKDTLIYRIEDANGDFDTAVVYINITPVNDKPLANVDGITLLEDDPATTINVLLNDDFGGDGPIPSSITILKQPVNGTASVDNNGTANNPTDDKIIYTPDPNYNGKDSLIYRIGDANGDYDTAIVFINITPVNDLPTADTEGVTVLEDAAITSIDVITNDDFGGDGPSAKDIIITKASVNGVATVNTNGTPNDPTDDTIDYTPNANFNGLDSLIYRIEDANGDFDTAIVYITVNAVNDKPIAGDDFIATPQAMPISGVVTANDSDVDGNLDVNSFVMLDGPTKGSITFNPNGSYTYTPNPTFSGTDSVRYKVCDLGTPSLCDTAKVYFFVNFVNHNPIATNEIETTPEDVVLINSVATNVTDEDANLNPTSFVTIDAPLHGTIVLNNDGSYTYTPTLNYNGVDSVHYKVCDYLGLCDTATIIVNITSVNDAPIASNVPTTTPEDMPLTSTVVGSSTDVDNNINPLGYTVTDAPVHGSIIMNPNGTFTYTPTGNFNGIDSVHYQVCDLGTPILCSTATLIITVTSVNDLPLANTEGVTILEDAAATTIDVIANDDFGGDGLSTKAVIITDAPSNGVATVDNNGTPTDPTDDKVIYTPNPNFNGRDTLIYRIEDANGDFDTAVVYIRITPVNDLPTAVRDFVSTDQDVTVTGTVATNDFDVDGNLNPNSFTLATLPNHGTITINPNGSYTYIPNVGYFGLDSVDYQVCDLAGLCAKEWLIITINHVNHAPVATNDVVNATEDTPLSNSVATNATDVDGDLNPTSFVAIDAPTNGTLVLNPNGTYTYTPNANFNGVDSVHYQVCDLSTPSLCDTATIIITVLPVNDKPVATNEVVNATEDTPLNDSVVTNATDVDSNLNPNSFVLIDAPTNGTLVLNPNGTYTYTPVANFNGVDSVHYQVCDLGTPALCDTATIIITVSPVNDKPVATNDVVTTTEDGPLSNSVATNVTDVDNNVNPNSFVAIDAPKHGTIVMNTDGTYTYTPTLNFSGVDSVHYQVCDLGTPAMCDTATIIITITPVNDAPVAGVDMFTTNEEVQVSGTVVLNDSDIDNNINPNSHAQVDAPKNGTFVISPNGNFTYNPNLNFFGIDTMSYQVCDLGTPALCDTALIIVNVSNVNDAPRANVDEGVVLVNGSTNVVILSNDTDADGVLTSVNTTITIDEAPKHGVASVNPDGTILYTPTANYVGLDTLIYKLCDNGTPQLCDTAIVFITVSATNNAPIANVDGITMPEDTTVVSIPVLSNDVDDQILTASNISITDAPKHGTVVINPNGTIGYTPNANYNGRDTLIYRVCDNATPALCDTAIVFINVTPVNDAPIATVDAGATTKNIAVDITVLGNDSDIETPVLTASNITITDAPNHGTASVNPNGTIKYTPAIGYIGKDTLIYNLCDNGTPNLCDTAIVFIDITALPNDAPVAVNDTTTTPEDVVLTGTVATNDTDKDGNLIPTSFVTTDLPTHGTIVMSPNGSYTYTPSNNFNGVDSVHYKVCDTEGVCDTATLIITITPVNDKPLAVDDATITAMDSPIGGTVATNDFDIDGNLNPTSFAKIGDVLHGTITINNTGSYNYVPTTGFVGKDSVQYQVCDLGGLCDTAWLVITVAPFSTNKAPIATEELVLTNVNTPANGTLTSKVSDPDGNLDNNSFAVVGTPKNGTITISATGAYIYTPNNNFVGEDSVQYRICDLGTPKLCDTSWILIVVEQPNRMPIATNDVVITTVSTPVNGVLTSKVTDPDANLDNSSFTVVGTPKNGTITINATGSYTYTPTVGFVGKDSVQYQVCDLGTPKLCDTAWIFITINQPNRAPIALNDNVITPMNNTYNGTLTSKVSDPDGNLNPNSFTQIGNATHGSMTINLNGSYSFIPTIGFVGKDSVQYQVCDLGTPKLCDTAWIVITILDAKPIAVDDAYTTDRNTTVGFKVTTNDNPKGTITTVNIITAPKNGSLNFVGIDSIRYTPFNGYCGADTLTYSLCNQFGLCDTAQVVVTMNCVAQPIAPVALNDIASTNKNQPVQIAMLDNDTTNGSLTKIEVITNPTRGTAVVQGNNIVYTPTTDLCGVDDTITYRICNANGCDTAQIVVSVSCGTVNNNANKPVAVDDAYTTDKGVSVTFKATANDTINGVLSGMNVIVDPRHGSILFRSPDTLIYTPQLGYCGKDTLTYVILNNKGLSDTANIYINITCTPDVATALPVAVKDVATTPKNKPVTIAVLTNDTLNGTLTKPIVIKTQPNRGIATVVNNDIVYTPQTGQCGFDDTLTYEICNIQGCSTAQVIVTVACPATLPIAIDDNYVTDLNKSIKFSPLTNDNINGVLKSVDIVVTAKHGTVGIVGDSLTYNPATGYCGKDTIQYSITRDDNEKDTAFIYVTINCGGVRPDAIADVSTGVKNTPKIITVLSNDATNGTLTKPVTVIKQPTRGNATVDASNNIIYTPIVEACGYTDTLTYEICNANGCDTAEVLVTINCIAIPDARNDVAVTSKNRTVDIDALTNDDINGTLDSFVVVTQPTRGSVSIVAGQLRYVPQTDSCGYNDTLTYKICNQNACDTASVIVTVTCDSVVKVAPVANVDFGKTPKATSITLNVLTNDSLYSQVLDSIVITQQPNHGSVVITQTRQLFYAPNATFCGGNDTLIYKICTAAGCDTALVVINVPCDTPALFPVANVDIDSTFRGMSIAIDVAFNDVLNGADTIRITQAPKHGTAAFDVDGYLIYQPDSIFCGGTDSLIYEICSLRGCDTALVLIHVKCDSIGLLSPIAFDDSATTQIDSAIVITILDNDILKGGTLQDSLVSKPRHGTVLFNNGTAFYMPNPGYWGLDTFEYAICNINGCDTARVVIRIDAGSNLTVFNGFSPDGDGMNDYFTIRGIEKYPLNDVILWNRWGNEVGSVKGYNNVDKIWDGTWNGKLVPDGTYFYIINFNDGVTKPVAGYVQIHR